MPVLNVLCPLSGVVNDTSEDALDLRPRRLLLDFPSSVKTPDDQRSNYEPYDPHDGDRRIVIIIKTFQREC